jgi:hypothetical protein
MAATDSEGPAWNKFWMSLDAETESVMSGEDNRSRSHLPPPMTPDASRSHVMSPDLSIRHGPILDKNDSVLPNDSASHHGIDSPEHSAITGPGALQKAENIPFPFKFKAPSGRMHRVQVTATNGIAGLVTLVAEKLGSEAETVGGTPEVNTEEGKIAGKKGFALAYLDNEGDTVSITTDTDLVEAVALASKAGREKVDLFVHDPDQPALPATTDPQPGLPEPKVRQRKRDTSEDIYEEEEDSRRRNRSAGFDLQQQEQMIPGVPNDLLLPGAIVTLAVVIAAVFTISRTTSNR